MSISFDSLPENSGSEFPPIPDGYYIGTVEKAEMKQPKEADRPEYLCITWKIKGQTSRMFDNFMNPEYYQHPVTGMKLRKFMEALGLKLTTFELKDLTKVTVGKSCRLHITKNENSTSNPNQVSIFDHPYEAITEDFMPAPTNEVPFKESTSAEPADIETDNY